MRWVRSTDCSVEEKETTMSGLVCGGQFHVLDFHVIMLVGVWFGHVLGNGRYRLSQFGWGGGSRSTGTFGDSREIACLPAGLICPSLIEEEKVVRSRALRANDGRRGRGSGGVRGMENCYQVDLSRKIFASDGKWSVPPHLAKVKEGEKGG